MSWKSRLALVAAVLLVSACADPDAGGPDGTDAGGGGGCEAPRQVCGTACVNTQSDPDHCGGCDLRCEVGSYCSAGECTAGCGSGLVECGASCADLSSDPDHCGDCGNVCAEGQVCEGGSCGCPDGMRSCDGVCVDVTTSTEHCGLCGRACDPGVSCEGGSCAVAGSDGGVMKDAGVDAGTIPGTDGGSSGCPAGTHACGTDCVADMANDPDNGCRLGCGDPCPTPAMATATCTSGGTCDFECISPATRVGDHCETAPACSADGAEDNDTQATAYALADFTDSPDTSMTFASFNLDSGADVDWYRFQVTDDGSDGNPVVEVALDRIPSGSDYELGAWFLCDAAGTTSVSCSSGSADTLGSHEGCTSIAAGSADELVAFGTSCSGIDESGIVLVRVESYSWGGSCDDYRLVINVH